LIKTSQSSEPDKPESTSREKNKGSLDLEIPADFIISRTVISISPLFFLFLFILDFFFFLVHPFPYPFTSRTTTTNHPQQQD
jgi:hypothetical protein